MIFTSVLGTTYSQQIGLELGVLPYIPNPSPPSVTGGPVVGAPWFHRHPTDPPLFIQGVNPPPPPVPSLAVTATVAGGPPILGAPWRQRRVPSEQFVTIQGAGPSPPSSIRSAAILLAQM